MENKSLKFYYKYPQRDLKIGITSIKSKKVIKIFGKQVFPVS